MRTMQFRKALLLLPLILPVMAAGQVLDMPLEVQEQSEWCWAADTSSILKYYGNPQSQCTIAEYTRTVATWHNFGTVNCCVDPSQGCNYWNYNYGSAGSMQDILKHWGINSYGIGSILAIPEIEEEIAASRPFIIRWAWTSGGGHFIVGHGILGTDLYYMNPWPGEGLKIGGYGWVVSGSNHTWTHSQKVGIPSVDITITAKPDNCSFTVDGETYTGARTFTWDPGSSHVIGVNTPQGSNGTRHVFANWSDGRSITHFITTPQSAATYTATFKTQYLLSTAASPVSAGTISPNPASFDGYHDDGTTVQLTAMPNANYAFSSWSGDLTGTANPGTVVMSAPRNVIATFSTSRDSYPVTLKSGGAAVYETAGRYGPIRAGYAEVAVDSGTTPYGIGVFSLKQNETIISEAGIPASPPTTRARIFIDFRKRVNAIPARSDAGLIDINTGIALVNYGSATADVMYALSDMSGEPIATGHGTIEAGKYFACFIDQLKTIANAPDFNLPADFATATQFGSLEITSSQPLSVLGLRGTMNQRNEFLMTTTPVADLTRVLADSPIYFPQFVDGGGYTTSIILLNTSSVTETGTLEIMDGNGEPFVVNRVGGTADSSFPYTIPPGGVFRLQTDGFPAAPKGGWLRLTPDAGMSTPIGSGVFGYNPDKFMISESGIPSAVATNHARIYLDLSRSHNTGLCLVNLVDDNAEIEIRAYESDDITPVGDAREPISLDPNGYAAAFADQFIDGLPAGFTGVLDINSVTPFAALTLRTLINERHEFLMTTFPIADANAVAPSPIVFPQVVDGGGYVTEFILISPGAASTSTVHFYDGNGAPIAMGK